MGDDGRPQGSVHTVLGPIRPDDLGLTSMHEHVLLDARKAWLEDSPEPGWDPQARVQLSTLGSVRWNTCALADNLVLDDDAEAAAELSEARERGLCAIVDLTNIGLGRSPDRLPAIAEASGVTIVLGCGFYVHQSHPDWVAGWDEERICQLLVKELDEGVGDTDIKAGIIGEIGTFSPVHEREERVLRASAAAALATGAALNVHVDESGTEGVRVLEILRGEGADLSRVILSHMDQQLDPAYLDEIAASGATLSFDCFGSETLTWSGEREPSDIDRMDAVARLVESGRSGQVVLGCDVWTKAMRKRFGGTGYEHLVRRIVPALRDRYQVAQSDLDAMLIDNPRRLLAR